MKQIWTLLFLLLVFVGCTKPVPVVVLDGWWNADFAKETCRQANEWRRENATLISQVGCDKVISCQEMMTIVEACVIDPVQSVRIFEDKLATAFASTPDCRFIKFVHFKGPDENNKAASESIQKQHYTIMLYYKPGAQKQEWSMIRSDHNVHLQAEGNPDEIARKVCTIVSQRGASINN